MTTTPQQLLTMYHPSFREGYQAGRLYAFEQEVTLTDMQLVENLQSIFQENEASPKDESVYYTIGSFVGQMSAWVIARMPHEDSTRSLQETFLAKVLQMHGAAGQSLAETIGQFWSMQDQLSLTLRADMFEQMLHRGTENRSL